MIESKILLARERQATDPIKKSSYSEGVSDTGASTRPPLLYLTSETEEEAVIPLNPQKRQETLWDLSKTDFSIAPIMEVYVSSISGTNCNSVIM